MHRHRRSTQFYWGGGGAAGGGVPPPSHRWRGPCTCETEAQCCMLGHSSPPCHAVAPNQSLIPVWGGGPPLPCLPACCCPLRLRSRRGAAGGRGIEQEGERGCGHSVASAPLLLHPSIYTTYHAAGQPTLGGRSTVLPRQPQHCSSIATKKTCGGPAGARHQQRRSTAKETHTAVPACRWRVVVRWAHRARGIIQLAPAGEAFSASAAAAPVGRTSGGRR